jgi:NTE family protein
MMRTPEALVLGGGGVLGEAWMSAVLAGLDESEHFDARGCNCYVGTSAGSIVAASLASGQSPTARLAHDSQRPPASPRVSDERVVGLGQALDVASQLAASAAAPFAGFVFASAAPGGALLRRAALRRVPRGRRSLARLGRLLEEASVRWDGRLRVIAVGLDTGQRVIFGAEGGPEASVSVAVQASCAIPGVFRPVLIGGRAYVDGGVWSPTNMDAAEVARGDSVLCLNPTGSLRPSVGTLAGALGPLSRGRAYAESLVLRNRGAIVSSVNPDQASAAAMGSNLMDPARRRAVIEAGLTQGRELALCDQRRTA